MQSGSKHGPHHLTLASSLIPSGANALCRHAGGAVCCSCLLHIRKIICALVAPYKLYG